MALRKVKIYYVMNIKASPQGPPFLLASPEVSAVHSIVLLENVCSEIVFLRLPPLDNYTVVVLWLWQRSFFYEKLVITEKLFSQQRGIHGRYCRGGKHGLQG